MNDGRFQKISISIMLMIAGWVCLSINDLNKNISTVIERTVNHEYRIQSIEKNFYHLGGN